MDFNSKNVLVKNTNSKEFLETQLKELDSDFNLLYERMNKRRNLLNNLNTNLNTNSNTNSNTNLNTNSNNKN
jgi:hypothetical protein